MKKLRFENLIDSRTGETLEVDVPDDFDENNPDFVATTNSMHAMVAQ